LPSGGRFSLGKLMRTFVQAIISSARAFTAFRIASQLIPRMGRVLPATKQTTATTEDEYEDERENDF